jgi:hypothetical protein
MLIEILAITRGAQNAFARAHKVFIRPAISSQRGWHYETYIGRMDHKKKEPLCQAHKISMC